MKTELDNLPKLKDTKLKIKMTFCMTPEAHRIYILAKQNLNVDTTEMINQAIANTMLSIKHLVDKQ